MDINFGDAASGNGPWFGFFTTAAGIVLGSLGTWVSQRSQRKFDASQRALDRANALRKDVCIKATETMTAAMTALTNLASDDDKKDDKWNEARAAFLATLQQLQLVGGDKTVLAANQMNVLFTHATLSITIGAAKVKEKRKTLEHAKSWALSENEIVEETRAQLDEIEHEVGIRAIAQRESLNTKLQLALSSHGRAQAAWRRAEVEVQAEVKHFILGLVGPIDPLQKKGMELLDVIREDLGHPPLDPKVREEMLANAQALRAKVGEIPDAFDKAMAGRDPQDPTKEG